MTPLLACFTCMGGAGAAGHQSAIAAGNAILLMLFVVLGMALLLGAFITRLALRARKHARTHPVPTAPDPMDAIRAARA